MRNKRKKLAKYGSKAKKRQDKKLAEHNDLGYLEDLAHLYKLGAISESKRDWIETTMLGLRDRANCYEKVFAKYLMDKKIKFIHQAPFIFSGKIYFADFYLPDQNTIVEFNGIQHYEEVECFHKGDNGFVKQKERDKRLRKWCKDNGVRLITIKYTQIDNIKRILKDKLLNKNGNEND